MSGFYEEAFVRFEEWGEHSVARKLFSGEIAPKNREAALVWLGERDKRAISTQARAVAVAEAAAAAAVKQAEIAARLANSARNANRLAIIAIVISLISTTLAVIGITSHSG
ncbi:MAG: hypothetical protein HIU82_20240 [Proteobacteria bacterium]|nr:hypothetical protein [Pseudomonadota bacterium]